MSFHAVHPFSRREALCILPLPLLPSFSAWYRCPLSAAFSVFRSGASACASRGTFASFAAFYSSSPLPLRPSFHKMTTPLHPNNCKQWLKADGSWEKWKPKEAGQMSFVVFQPTTQTCMCPPHATFVVLVSFSVACLLDSASCFRCPCFPNLDGILSCTAGYWSGWVAQRAKKKKKVPDGWDATKSFYVTTVLLYRVKVPKAAKKGAVPQVCDCERKADQWFKYKRVCQCVASVPLVSRWPVLCFSRSSCAISWPPNALLGSFRALSTFCALGFFASTAAYGCTLLYSCSVPSFQPQKDRFWASTEDRPQGEEEEEEEEEVESSSSSSSSSSANASASASTRASSSVLAPAPE